MNLIKKLLLTLAVVGGLIGVKPAYAHPPDTTTTNITLPKEGLNPVKVEVLMPWSEALVITQQASSAAEPKMEMFVPYETQIKSYIAQNLLLSTDGGNCESSFIEMVIISQDELLFGQGIPFKFEFNCQQVTGKLTIKNSMFVNDFPTQNNIINVYREDQNNFVAGISTYSQTTRDGSKSRGRKGWTRNKKRE